MIIGIDLDGVCRNFLGALHSAFVEKYPKLQDKVGPAETYDFAHLPFEEVGIDPHDFIDNAVPKEVFGLSPPIEGAIPAAREINSYAQRNGHKALICSHQQKHVQHYSWLWLYINKLDVPTTIFVRDSKDKWNYVDLMIDDSPHVLAEKPDNKISVKVNHPYNAAVPADYNIDHLSEFLPLFSQEIEKRPI